MSAIPDRYRGSDPEELALFLLADVLDPPPPEQAAADPARWRAAIATCRAPWRRPDGGRAPGPGAPPRNVGPGFARQESREGVHHIAFTPPDAAEAAGALADEGVRLTTASPIADPALPWQRFTLRPSGRRERVMLEVCTPYRAGSEVARPPGARRERASPLRAVAGSRGR